MVDKKTIAFQPFMKFIIEFHNNLTFYRSILKKEFPKLTSLENEEISLLEESYLIKIAAEWETFTHNIISYCIAMDTNVISKHLELNLPVRMSFDNAYSVLNGLQYKTITSSNELRSLAKKVLADKYNPFIQLDRTNLNKIDDLYAIRNYIAHKSQRSKERLLTMYRNRYNITDFITPGLFLIEIMDASLGISRRDLLYGAVTPPKIRTI